MAQTHQGGKFFFSPTAAPDIMTQADFEAISDWVKLPFVVTAPSFQIVDNMLTENTLDTDISVKQKGFRNIEETEVVLSFKEGNAAHAQFQGLARTKLIYPVYYELDNAPDDHVDSRGRITYARTLIGGGGTNGGEGEEFVRRTFMLGITEQFPIEVAAVSGA